MKPIAIFAAAAAAIALSQPASAQTSDVTVDQMYQAINGMPLNGGTLALSASTTSQGTPYLTGVIPNTSIRFDVMGITCATTTPRYCVGMYIYYVGNHALSPTFVNAFNRDRPYSKTYAHGGAAIVSRAEMMIGLYTVAAAQLRVLVFTEDLAVFLNNVNNQAVADTGGDLEATQLSFSPESEANAGPSKELIDALVDEMAARE